MNNPYLFLGLELSPQAIQRIVATVEPSRYDEKTDPDRFSLREAVAHMADWEPILLLRMKTAVDAPGTTIRGIDEGKRAIDMGYETSNPVEEAAKLAERRMETIAFLKEHGAGNWEKSVTHNERGVQTLYDQATLLLGHDHYHIEHLTRYL